VLFVLATSAHLAISIHQREARFTYHVVPFVAVLSTLALWQLIQALAKSIAQRWTVATLAALLLVFAFVQISSDLRGMGAATTWSESPVIKFGDYVAQHYPPETKILADSYAYVPPQMTNVTFSNHQNNELLGRVAPELVILTSSVTGNYVWKKPGTTFAEGDLVKDERYVGASEVEAYLKKLLTSSDWSVVHEDESEVLLQRKR
jgi:asparagine N-glycosylation enzyme membrane subunit Stt3